MFDFRIGNEGTVWTFQPLTQAAKEWVEEHVDVPERAWMGGRFTADHRPARHLAEGIEEAGFSIEFD